jgi:hypothetical protein
LRGGGSIERIGRWYGPHVRLKQMVADQALDIQALRALARGKW